MSCNESEYDLVTVDSQTALAAPRECYFNEEGITAYSCLIPQTLSVAKVVHFVTGADGEEYGQFATKASAKDEAAAVVRAHAHP